MNYFYKSRICMIQDKRQLYSERSRIWTTDRSLEVPDFKDCYIRGRRKNAGEQDFQTL